MDAKDTGPLQEQCVFLTAEPSLLLKWVLKVEVSSVVVLCNSVGALLMWF